MTDEKRREKKKWLRNEFRFNFHSPTFKRAQNDRLWTHLYRSHVSRLTSRDKNHSPRTENRDKPVRNFLVEKNFRTSFECPCFPHAETPREPRLQPTSERTTVVIIEVTRRVSRRSAPRTSPTSLSGWRRETMNNGTSRFA